MAKEILSCRQACKTSPTPFFFVRAHRKHRDNVYSPQKDIADLDIYNRGTFPLYSVANYAEKLPKDMAAKGGLFLPMYRTFFFSLLTNGP